LKNRKLTRELKINQIILFLFLFFLIYSCNDRPSYVLSESKMEKVLYDVYLAEAETNTNYSYFMPDSGRRQELLNSVLKKHKITEAKLDTSLAWYSGRIEKYLKINDKVIKRFTEASENLGKHENLLKEKSFIEESSAFYLPVDKERFLLKISDLPRKSYAFKADTTLNRYGGRYELEFNILGVSTSLNPVITLCVQCVDTAFVKSDTINNNGLFSTSINILQGKQAKALYGSIFFPEVNSGMGIFIWNFKILYDYKQLPVIQPTEKVIPISIQN